MTAGHIDEDAESAGAPGASHAEEPNRELGDAGMVLRDPPTLHLIIHQVLFHVEVRPWPGSNLWYKRAWCCATHPHCTSSYTRYHALLVPGIAPLMA